MDLREIEATLPPGFRFYPSDEELVCYYLYRKITNEKISRGTMVEVDLHTCEPWQLPDVAKLGANEWYFFSFRERKYATGLRTNRATVSGYWKATGKDRPILNSVTQATVGMRKTLVFYRDRAPNGIKTGWIMHEFRLEIPTIPSKDWVLCRIFHKGKGELATMGGSFEDEFDATIDECCPIFNTSPPVNPTPIQAGLPDLVPFPQTLHCQENYNSNALLNAAHLNPTFLELPVEVTNLVNNACRGGDEYGYLYDMNLDD